LAVANYHDAHGHYPPAYLADADGRPMHSWRVLLLPYLEQYALYEQYDFSQPWDSPKNLALADKMPEVYALHGNYEPGLTITNYLAVVGPETMWPGPAPRQAEEITDEISSTILVVENVGAGVHWMSPRDLAFSSMSFAMNSPQGVSSKYVDPAVAMTDGSIRRLSKDLPPSALKALLTVAGGEEVRQHEGRFDLLPDGRDRPLAPPVQPSDSHAMD
jgi:hypothetical protein